MTTAASLAHEPLENPASPKLSSRRQKIGSLWKRYRFPALCLGSVLLSLGLAAAYILHTPSVPGLGSSIRLSVNLKTLGPEDFPSGESTCFPDIDALLPVRKHARPIPFEGGDLISRDALFEGPEAGHYGFAEFNPPAHKRGLVNFTHGLVSIDTVDGAIPLALLRHSPVPHMPVPPDMFQADLFTTTDYMEGDPPPLLYGEETDESGLPSRWNRPGDAVPGLLACSLISNYGSELHQFLRSSRFTAGAEFSGQASRYRTIAKRYAEKYNLAASLIMAIMHTESNFNPYAVSRSQAVGLMQIVPATAGHEVYRYLTGLPGKPSPEILFSPEHNIKYGTIYLHLLSRYYFGNVANPRSRQMCMIAAYNGGPGAVLRLFDADQDAAVSRINSLSPDSIYKMLTTEMPNAETRRYVDLVLGRMQNYASY